MITWAEIVLLLLKIADSVLTTYKEGQQVQAGTDAEIAKTSVAILAKTAAAKKIKEQVNALTMDAVDKQLSDLEPR
jgi:hypothetical protein